MFMFTYHKNIRFQKKFVGRTGIYGYNCLIVKYKWLYIVFSQLLPVRYCNYCMNLKIMYRTLTLTVTDSLEISVHTIGSVERRNEVPNIL